MASNSLTSAPAMKPLSLAESRITPSSSPEAIRSSKRSTIVSSSAIASRDSVLTDALGVSMVSHPSPSKSISKRQFLVWGICGWAKFRLLQLPLQGLFGCGVDRLGFTRQLLGRKLVGIEVVDLDRPVRRLVG